MWCHWNWVFFYGIKTTINLAIYFTKNSKDFSFLEQVTARWNKNLIFKVVVGEGMQALHLDSSIFNTKKISMLGKWSNCVGLAERFFQNFTTRKPSGEVKSLPNLILEKKDNCGKRSSLGKKTQSIRFFRFGWINKCLWRNAKKKSSLTHRKISRKNFFATALEVKSWMVAGTSDWDLKRIQMKWNSVANLCHDKWNIGPCLPYLTEEAESKIVQICSPLFPKNCLYSFFFWMSTPTNHLPTFFSLFYFIIRCHSNWVVASLNRWPRETSFNLDCWPSHFT